MKRLEMLLIVIIAIVSTKAFASTVNTIDGNNFLVTDDAGLNREYTLNEMNQIVSDSSDQRKRALQQAQVKDETYLSWYQIQQQAIAGAVNWQANQPPPMQNNEVTS